MEVPSPVGYLQDLCVQENNSSPIYNNVPRDSNSTIISCIVEAFGYSAKGTGRSKKEAEYDASANLLSKLFYFKFY